jgi:nitroreductase
MRCMSLNQSPNPEEHRKPEYPIESLFIRRWSPRAMSGEALTDEEIMRVFEAARWAPSTYNEQEWRFLYARRDTPQWPLFFDLLMEANKEWCDKAAVLCVVLARKTFTRNGKPNPVHLYDTGSAWQNLTLQATAIGLVSHGMAGFDFDRARKDLQVPEDFAVAAMFALGRRGNPGDLPAELRERETITDRRPIRQSICEGVFSFDTL